MNTRAFDTAAARYDEEFDENIITAVNRRAIRETALQCFHAGERILELNCGTGTDALALAAHGIDVLAIDNSPEMIRQARLKIAGNDLSAHVEFRVHDLEQIDAIGESSFDGVFSNFGGLNCVRDLRPFIPRLSHAVKPGGAFIACLMNDFCLWESAGFLVRGKFKNAFRRMSPGGIEAPVGTSAMQVWYYSPAEWKSLLSPWFEVESTYGLNILSPLPSSRKFHSKHPALTRHLLSIDAHARSSSPFSRWGDHFVTVAHRTTYT